MGFLSEFVNSYLFQVSVSSGLLWGGIIAALYRWAGRRLPDKEALNKRSIRVLFITASIIAILYYYANPNGY